MTDQEIRLKDIRKLKTEELRYSAYKAYYRRKGWPENAIHDLVREREEEDQLSSNTRGCLYAFLGLIGFFFGMYQLLAWALTR